MHRVPRRLTQAGDISLSGVYHCRIPALGDLNCGPVPFPTVFDVAGMTTVAPNNNHRMGKPAGLEIVAAVLKVATAVPGVAAGSKENGIRSSRADVPGIARPRYLKVGTIDHCEG